MYAIVENGSKQYKVQVDDLVKFEKLDAEVGAKVEFTAVFVSDENGVKFGKDAEAYKAVGVVTRQDKEKKILVFKYKAKKNVRKRRGHRQPFTVVKITEIVAK